MRDPGITFIAWFAILVGVVEILTGFSIYNAQGTTTQLNFIVGSIYSLLGLARLMFGYGALRLKHWAWTLGVTMFVLADIIYILGLFTTPYKIEALIGITVNSFLLFYMFLPFVRSSFQNQPKEKFTT